MTTTIPLPVSADDVRAIIRAWLDSDDASHHGRFERALDAVLDMDGPSAAIDASVDAVQAATALIEWCRRQSSRAGTGHIDENQRFVLRGLLEEFDRANALSAALDHTGAAVRSAQSADAETVRFVYRNYRGEIGIREVRAPLVGYMGSTEWHPERQWLCRAFDVEKQAYRDFAVADMRMLDALCEPAA